MNDKERIQATIDYKKAMELEKVKEELRECEMNKRRELTAVVVETHEGKVRDLALVDFKGLDADSRVGERITFREVMPGDEALMTMLAEWSNDIAKLANLMECKCIEPGYENRLFAVMMAKYSKLMNCNAKLVEAARAVVEDGYKASGALRSAAEWGRRQNFQALREALKEQE